MFSIICLVVRPPFSVAEQVPPSSRYNCLLTLPLILKLKRSCPHLFGPFLPFISIKITGEFAREYGIRIIPFFNTNAGLFKRLVFLKLLQPEV